MSWTILRDHITESYNGIVLRNSYYGIVLRDHITELDYKIMVNNHIMRSYYRIRLRNDIMELYCGLIVMKRIPGMLGTLPEPPGIPGIAWARPWAPRGRPWDPLARPWDPQGTSLRLCRDAPGTLRGPLWPTKKAISK